MTLSLDNARECVAFLFVRKPTSEGDEGEPWGTCFFGKLGGSSGWGYHYLITAAHVIDQLRNAGQRRMFVRLNKPGGGVAYLPVPLDRGWLRHDDDSVDVALYKWDVEQSSNYEITSMDLDPYADPDYRRSQFLREAEDVAYYGMMRNFVGRQKNLMALRIGSVALVTDELIAKERDRKPAQYHVIDSQSYPGNSGAPVFLVVARSLDLIGVLVAGVPTKAALVRNRSTHKIDEYVNLGMTLVTPVEKVVEVLNQKAERKRREPASAHKQESIRLAAAPSLSRAGMESALKKVAKRRPKTSKPASRKRRT